MSNLEQLETKMTLMWQHLLASPLAENVKKVLLNGDRKLYALWLCQVAHLTRHTSAHQALVGTRIDEISQIYMHFCFEHALEEVGHEWMALRDLKKIGFPIFGIDDLPNPLPATEQLTAYLYYAAERAHPATRLGFSYWAEKCYPFIQEIARSTQTSLGLNDAQMSFFVSHAKIDEKHAADVERVIQAVCLDAEAWFAVETGMVESLNLAVRIFEDIHALTEGRLSALGYQEFLAPLESEKSLEV